MEHPQTPLSVVFHPDGFIVERYQGDRLGISRKDGRRVTDDDAERITRWYWTFVGVKGNDPEPLDPPDAFDTLIRDAQQSGTYYDFTHAVDASHRRRSTDR